MTKERFWELAGLEQKTEIWFWIDFEQCLKRGWIDERSYPLMDISEINKRNFAKVGTYHCNLPYYHWRPLLEEVFETKEEAIKYLKNKEVKFPIKVVDYIE